MVSHLTSPGDSPTKGPLNSKIWNQVVESSNDYRDRRALGSVVTPPPGLDYGQHALFVKVENTTGSDVREGEVLEFTGSAVTELFNRKLMLTGVNPNLERVGWGITAQPIPAGEINRIFLSGACLAYVVIKDETHKYADRVSGSRVLESAATGPVKILHKPTGGTPPEERECVVQLMDETVQIVQFTTTEYMAESTPGASEATIDWPSGGTPTEPPKVYHVNGQFPDVHSGAKGTAIFDPQLDEAGDYRIMSSQRVAIFAEAFLAADLCDDEATTASISGFAVKPTGDYVGSPPTIPTVANVGTIHLGKSGDKVLLRRINNDMPEPVWEIIAIDKHVISYVTDVVWDGTDLKQKKVTAAVELCDTTEAETTIDTTEDCE